MVVEPLYGNFDGQACRITELGGEAWVLSMDRTAWKEINGSSCANAMQPLTKAEFEAKFPDIPPLPPEAFSENRDLPPEER